MNKASLKLLSSRALARQADSERYLKIGCLHKHAVFLLQSDRRIEVISKAEERIKKWEEGKLCSRFYIDSWRRLLKLDPAQMEREIQEGPQAHAFAQNTPFSFLMKEVE